MADDFQAATSASTVEEDRASLLSVKSINPSPDALSKLVKRLRILTLTLLPVEVSSEEINAPTSRIITPQVISAYRASAGDFTEALPYCLLRARQEFLYDAYNNAADYEENHGRAVACEVLARRIVHLTPSDRITTIMSTRFRHRQLDGSIGDTSSALELAIDTHWQVFSVPSTPRSNNLNSGVSNTRQVVLALWNGILIQRNNKHHDIDYVPYDKHGDLSFLGHFDPSRLSVPRYQNIFRVTIWLCFLLIYSQAVREPLDKVHPDNTSFDPWEILLYVFALSFFIEGATIIFVKLLGFVFWGAFTFWNIVALITDSVVLSAFVLRLLSMQAPLNSEKMFDLRVKSFRVLSYAAPMIWQLITVFDGYKYIGTMQICIASMLKESGIFFALLSILAIGFGQGLYAIDVADGASDIRVVNTLVEALLQSPDYGNFSGSPSGLWLFYLWNVATAVILLNVLISLFASAYQDVVDDAEAQYLAFFASKAVGMIRAPDSYVYPAPFNLVEILFVAPFEMISSFRLSTKAYAQLNRCIMTVLFFLPLSAVAFYESVFRNESGHWWIRMWLGSDEGDEDSPEARDPEVNDGHDDGLTISKVPFSELIKVFPDTTQSSEATIIKEIRDLKAQLNEVMAKLEASGALAPS
ncbi:hypothetical protein FISHEDRAFT_41344 [Fistulina hepatica ATCC 64428]|nr:hypothetical protein FISHEDRAFT_41344 [Fistulina hepatica ATCC 64428]